MGRSKKSSAIKHEADDIVPQVQDNNKAETTIIPDVEQRISVSSKRRSVKGVQPGEIVTVHNKENGAVNRMAGAVAVKLVERGEGVYEIVR